MANSRVKDSPLSIIRFWRLVEMLTPTSFPKEDHESREHPVYNVRSNGPMPWEEDHDHAVKKCDPRQPQMSAYRDNKAWSYGVYAGLIDINIVRADIENQLGVSDDHAVRDERKPEGTSLVGFQVNGYGKVVSGSLVVSSFAWAYGELYSQGGNSAKHAASKITAERFKEAEEEIADKFAGQLAGEHLTLELLNTFLSWLVEKLSLPPGALISQPCRIECVLNYQRGGESEEESGNALLNANLNMLNSLLSEDLSLVESEVGQDEYGKALASYLGKPPPKQHDLRTAHRETWGLLDPGLYPQGRWPTKGRFPLVFSQQVAVNQAFRQFMAGPKSERGGLMAVNGPPGTGKTTLLKDVLAGIVVERAKVLASFKEPGDAFKKNRLAWEHRGWRQWHSPVDSRLHDFGVVVASSNNGAVANITQEFPKGEDVDPEWAERESPFGAVATAMLEGQEEAWALLAARLGNSKNRKAFVDQFWGELPKNIKEGDDPRVQAILKNAKEDSVAKVADWEDAVNAFKVALKKEEECRKVRHQLYRKSERQFDLLSKIRQLEKEILSKTQGMSDLVEKIKNIQARHDGLEKSVLQKVESAKNHRDELLKTANHLEADLLNEENQAEQWLLSCQYEQKEHDATSPGKVARLISKLFGGGKRIKAWEGQLRHLESQVSLAKSKYTNTSQRLGNMREKVSLLKKPMGSEDYKNAAGEEYHAYGRVKRELSDANKSCKILKNELDKATARLAIDKTEQESILTELKQYDSKHLVTPSVLFGPAKNKETLSPWTDPEWEGARAAVFISALNLHDSFVVHAGQPMIHNLTGAIKMVRGDVPHDIPDGVAETLWSTLFLMVPLISTTFASFGRQFRHLGRESLGWLLIDEAGQAAPQNAAGALWRSRRAMVVGDPLQLEPVVTVPDRLQAVLATYCDVSKHWLPSFTSTQALSDAASQYGSYIGKTWVGAPLLVHRRCESPMFEISNAVAYEGAMVHASRPKESPLPPSCWVDVPAREANGHWIPGEGEAIEQLINDLSQLDVKNNEIFLISPFRSVVTRLLSLASQPKYKGVEAGTIHTVQGKEAEVVILVLGGDPEKAGAKSWASSSPNLVNVAVSRAKHRLYVVGDRQEWRKYPYFDECDRLLPRQGVA